MEVNVSSLIYGSKFRNIIITLGSLLQGAPHCCAYSCNKNVFQCLEGISLFCAEYGYMNIHRSISNLLLTMKWKIIYENIPFPIHIQSSVDAIRTTSKFSVFSGTNKISQAFLAARGGRPTKNTGKRNIFCERGLDPNHRRSYSCLLFKGEDNTSYRCPLIQPFS